MNGAIIMTMQHEPRAVGVIGLGLMGVAITERLLEHGYTPHVWNRTKSKADPLLARGAVWSDNPLAGCRRVIVSLFSSNVVDDVLTPMLAGLNDGGAGRCIIDTTTGEPASAVVWSERLLTRGGSYLDAPISGSSEQTRRGHATVIVGGDASEFALCQDLWPILGANVFHVGGAGSASKMKLVSNLVLGLNRAALAEGLALAEALGFDLPATLAVLRGSAAYSRQMDAKGPKMIEHEFTPQARLAQHLKDVGLIMQAAADVGLTLTLTPAHRALLERAERMGLGDLDNSAVFLAARSKNP